MIDEEAKRKIHIRNTDFFLKNYKTFADDVDRTRIKDIIDVELECLGYGVFNPKKLLQNFTEYALELFRTARTVSNIKMLKITLNGFALDPSDPVLQKLAKQIPSVKLNISKLMILTSNLSGVTLKDFNQLLRLSHNLSDINFETFVLQCANWTFTPTQPSFTQLRKIFQMLIKQAADITKILNKTFRLQMSGWYYTLADARAFLGFKLDQKQLKKVPQKLRPQYTQGIQYSDQVFFKQLQKFFVGMQTLIKQLLNVMDNIQQLQLDMRNTHQVLKMKNLKKRLDNITKQNRYQKSIMSKRIDVNADQAEKQLRLNIVM